ncbi:MAG: class I SAM-dependent methyltransferase [Anaerolineae bacterium]|nr:class I SAM-dependent methyltransferase [Anaerolineae bacterium]
MFKRLIWKQDRVLLDDLVFRLQHYKSDNWELGDECFIFFKIKHLIDQYAHFWGTRNDFKPKNILELGMFDGGSVAFWFEYFKPEKHVGVDIQQKQDSSYFRKYIQNKALQDRISTFWSTNQGDSKRLRQIVNQEFSGPLDLVIDDASHMYDLTRQSFLTLFPLLRPGGLYVIEDWAWGHWQEFIKPDHPWSQKTPLTQLIIELVEATGSTQGNWTEQAVVSNLAVYQGFVVVEKGKRDLAETDFELEDYINRVGK